MQLHELTIDTLRESSLRGYVDYHDALVSLSDLSKSVIGVSIDVLDWNIMQGGELGANLFLSRAVPRDKDAVALTHISTFYKNSLFLLLFCLYLIIY